MSPALPPARFVELKNIRLVKERFSVESQNWEQFSPASFIPPPPKENKNTSTFQRLHNPLSRKGNLNKNELRPEYSNARYLCEGPYITARPACVNIGRLLTKKRLWTPYLVLDALHLFAEKNSALPILCKNVM